MISTTLIFSVMNERNTSYFVTENIDEVLFNNEFITGLLKMWPDLQDQKYKWSNLNDFDDYRKFCDSNVLCNMAS